MVPHHSFKPKVSIIGGGIVGLATAYQVLAKFPTWQVRVIEKEAQVGCHQSTHNSGVLHAGIYYRPGSAKARLAVRGIRAMTDFCRHHAIPFEVCGKLVVAVDEEESERLRILLNRGKQNGLSGLEWLEGREMRQIEPHVGGVAAVRVPEEGIVDYGAVCKCLSDLIHDRGGKVHLGSVVDFVEKRGQEWIVRAGKKEWVSDWIINCAGLHCDRVCCLAGEAPETKIVPFRGEYFRLKAESASLVRNLIYPVPDLTFPFLGVHFTRMMSGGVEAGPNAVLALSREGYRWRDVNLKDCFENIRFIGLWRFIARHPKMSVSEVMRSCFKPLFVKALQRLVPEIRSAHLEPGGAGVRAQAMRLTGELEQDFLIVKGAGALHLLNAPSPGATASLAIGEELAGLIG